MCNSNAEYTKSEASNKSTLIVGCDKALCDWLEEKCLMTNANTGKPKSEAFEA